MYHLSTSFLALFFLLSFFHHLSCASNKTELGWCEALFQCGNITAGFPFWGGNRPETCGLGQLELRCNRKNITSLNISNYEHNVFHIDQTSHTLRLARADFLGSFCAATFNTTTLPPEIFELSPTYKNLTIFYLCNPRLHYVSSYTCPGRGPVSAYLNPKYYRSCQETFTLTVPTRFIPEEEELNVTRLEIVLRKGYEVKVKIDEIPCEECTSSDAVSNYKHHRRCSKPFRCGDQSGLLYPFWIPGREDCGHPEFKLKCNTSFAEFSLESVKFRILEANYDSRLVRLVGSDYINKICVRNQPTVQFIQGVLLFTPDTELLSIYYHCQDTGRFYDHPKVREFPCDNDSITIKNYYYVPGNTSSPLLDGNNDYIFDSLRVSCTSDVSIPVSGSVLNSLGLDNLTKILEHGFELGLNQDCSTCIESKGACGYNRTSRGFVCYCKDGTHGHTCGFGKRSHGTSWKAISIGTGSVAGVVLFLVFLSLFLRFLRKRETRLRQRNLLALIPLKHYTYARVKRITKSFGEVVGRGGFGIVYKGTLSDGRMVAVKILKDSKGNGEDFINEVASMSQTSHLNIVSLLGFCSEGSKRAIIYEFLGNGSLEKFISRKTRMIMDWTTLYNIALGVARGLEYLHHGCKTRIVHFDIKPQNVLLDEDFCPKVSDFGLAKLCEKKESALSLLETRGTVGYIAPEMISRIYGNVSHKSDVYSYGMLVLEMIGARNKERAHQEATSNVSSMYFPEWIYRDLEKEDSGTRNEDDEIAKKMTLVGLWCIQSSPLDRPPMNRIVEMMEGSLDALEVPPRPVWQTPTVPLQESSTFSEDISV